MMRLFLILYFLTQALHGWTNDSLLQALIKEHLLLFEPVEGSFKGEGWELIIARAADSRCVIIGEEHFIKEVPGFVAALARGERYTHFVTETDPHSARILQEHIKASGDPAEQDSLLELRSTFGFFALKPEFEMLSELVEREVSIHGTDQVQMLADALLAYDGLKRDPPEEVALVLEKIMRGSAAAREKLMTGVQARPYMISPEFELDLVRLETLDLDPQLREMVAALRESRAIYMDQDHHRRVALMRRELDRIGLFEEPDSKILLKYGANHSPRGESLLGPPDVGEAISTRCDEVNGKSLHILIVAHAGMMGSPFPSMPARAVDHSSGELSALQPFFDHVKSTNWHCIDLVPLRQAMEGGDMDITGDLLIRTIRGYDLLVIIPEATAAQFLTP